MPRMLKIVDVSRPLSPDLPVYPGDTPFERALESPDKSPGVVVSRLVMSAHAGTHVDAPRHFFPEGAAVDRIPLEILIGRARLIELPGAGLVERADLAAFDLREDIRLLVKTRASSPSYSRSSSQDLVHLSLDSAKYLAQIGIKLLGIDHSSVDRTGDHDFPAHRELLRAGIVLIEGLDFSSVEPGEYELICLPLSIRDGEAAPARVVLRSRR
ncbi:MAG: cyclase family protein [Vicinamibacteria bacterium]|nr:cyclase family protein [Vicinamibacteria bacterium]